jgi:hypothetical protein
MRASEPAVRRKEEDQKMRACPAVIARELESSLAEDERCRGSGTKSMRRSWRRRGVELKQMAKAGQRNAADLR